MASTDSGDDLEQLLRRRKRRRGIPDSCRPELTSAQPDQKQLDATIENAKAKRLQRATM